MPELFEIKIFDSENKVNVFLCIACLIFYIFEATLLS